MSLKTKPNHQNVCGVSEAEYSLCGQEPELSVVSHGLSAPSMDQNLCPTSAQ